MACCKSCADRGPAGPGCGCGRGPGCGCGCAGRRALGGMDPALHAEALEEMKQHPWVTHAQAMQIARDHRGNWAGAKRGPAVSSRTRFAPTQARLIRNGQTLGFVGPLLSLVSAVTSARALGGLGECPEARTAGGRSYFKPWDGYGPPNPQAPSYMALSDWYDKAETEIGRLAQHPNHDPAKLAILQKRWEDLPNRARAMIDAMGAGLLVRELAQHALCQWHDAQYNDNAAAGLRPLPAPLPAEELPSKIDDWVKETFRIPWWVYLAGGAAVYFWVQSRLPRSRR